MKFENRENFQGKPHYRYTLSTLKFELGTIDLTKLNVRKHRLLHLHSRGQSNFYLYTSFPPLCVHSTEIFGLMLHVLYFIVSREDVGRDKSRHSRSYNPDETLHTQLLRIYSTRILVTTMKTETSYFVLICILNILRQKSKNKQL